MDQFESAPVTSGAPTGRSTSGRPAVAVLAWLSAGCIVLGSAVPLFSGASGSGNNLFSAGGKFVVFLIIVCGLLAISGTVAATRPAAAGLAGGAGLIGGLTFGFLASICVYLVTAFGDFGGPTIGIGPGIVLLLIGSVLCAFTFFAALSAPARRVGRSATLTGVAIPGALAACACSVGLLLPPPDLRISMADYLNSGNLAINVIYVAWIGGLAIAGLIGFLSRRRWGILLVAGAYAPMAWLGFSAIADLASKASGRNMLDDSFGSGKGLGQVFAEDLHPVFGIGLLAMGGAVVIGLLGSAGHATVPAGPPAAWAADPFGRHQLRYWDGHQWTAHVATNGVAATDTPVWAQQTPAAPLAFAPPTPPTPLAPPLLAAPLPVDESTVVRARGLTYSLVLDTGQRHQVSGFTLVGRDPEPAPGDPAASLVRIHDPERSVSKTHLAVSLRDGRLWVVDRGSSNGSTFVSVTGQAQSLAAHDEVEVHPGSRVTLGDRAMSIIAE